jgi:hypothetical protein
MLNEEELSFSDGKSKYNLAKLLSKYKQASNSSDDANKDFWDYAAESNLSLSSLMLGASSAKVEQLKKSYRFLWSIAGSPANKKSELEHLDILLRALQAVASDAGKELYKELSILRDELDVT